MNPQIINIAYIVSAVIFILGIKMLGKAETRARAIYFRPSACS